MNLNKENAPPSQLQTHQHSAMHKPHARMPVASGQQQQQQQQPQQLHQAQTHIAVQEPTQSTVLNSPVSSQQPKVYLTSDQIKVQLGKKLDDLDSKYLQHRNLAMTKALAAYDDLVIQSREDAVAKMREAHEAELSRERAAHASSLHALSLALQAAEARCTEMDNERTQTNLAMTELKRKYDMLWTKWKELKVLLASKTAAKNNQQQSSGRSSPVITAAATTTSTSPALIASASSSASPPAVQMPAAPTTISQLFADDTDENIAPPAAVTSSPRTGNAETVNTALNRAVVVSQDPFASQAQGIVSSHAPSMLQSRAMPSLAALIASSSSSTTVTTIPSTISTTSTTSTDHQPSVPVSLAAVLAASEGGVPLPSASAASNVWKSKKSHTNALQPQQAQIPAETVDAAIANAASPVAPVVVRPPSPSLPALESVFGVSADSEASSRISSASTASAAIAPPSSNISFHDRARVESIEDDDCIMVATAATSSVRKRAHASAVSPSRPRSTSPSASNAVPQTWKPSSTSNAARKRLREEERTAQTTNGPRRSLPPMLTGQAAPSPAKKQRPPVPIQPFNSPTITAASSSAHVPAATLITAPAPSSGVHSPAEQLSDPHSEGLSGLTQRPRQPIDTTDGSPNMGSDGHASRLTQEAKDTVEELPSSTSTRDAFLNISKPVMSLNAMLAANGNEILTATAMSTEKPAARVGNAASTSPLQTPPRLSPSASSSAQLIDITNSPPDVAVMPHVSASTSPPPISAPAPTPHISTERNRETRETLPGYSCKQCELFYAAVGKGGEHADGRTCEHVSRHRYEFPIALTPEHYWNIGSPESARSFHEESQSRPITNPSVQRSINAALSTATPTPLAVQQPTAATLPAITPSPAVQSRLSTIVAAAAVTVMPDYNPTSQELELDQQLYGNNSVSSMTD